jgi:hypothetical protein
MMGFAAQGRGLLLLARREERIEIEEQPLDGILHRVHRLFYTLKLAFLARSPGSAATPALRI